MRVTPEGRAGVGDVIVTGWGEYRTVVAIINAGDLIEAIAEQSITMRAPNFRRDSISGVCVLFGQTSGREKRDFQRWRARVAAQKGAA